MITLTPIPPTEPTPLEPHYNLLITGRHAVDHREQRVELINGSLVVFDSPASSVLKIAPSEEHFLCLVPLSSECRFFHNGLETPAGGFSVSMPGRGAIFRITAKGVFAAAWLSTKAAKGFQENQKPGDPRRVRVLESVKLPPMAVDFSELQTHAASIEFALLDALDSGWSRADSTSQPGRSSARAEIVQTVWDRVRADLQTDLPLEEWSRIVDSSSRTIEYAFSELTGLSPMVFIRCWRFAKARELLRQCLVKTVKDAAYGCGLMHLGRFSIDYRLQFGESPSETLAKARARHSQETPAAEIAAPTLEFALANSVVAPDFTQPLQTLSSSG